MLEEFGFSGRGCLGLRGFVELFGVAVVILGFPGRVSGRVLEFRGFGGL